MQLRHVPRHLLARQVSNEGGWGGESDASDGSDKSAADDQSGIFEEALDSSDTIDEIDSNTLEFEHVSVNKASVIRIIFGPGTTKVGRFITRRSIYDGTASHNLPTNCHRNTPAPQSNDRLKRVRGIGRAARLGVIPEDSAIEHDIDDIICTMDVCAVTAHVQGCDALCIVVVEELRCNGIVESELTLAELRMSTTTAKVKLAMVEEADGKLRYGGRCEAGTTITVDGTAVLPVDHSHHDESGVAYDLEQLRALANDESKSGVGKRRFQKPEQHAVLVHEGSRGRVEAQAAEGRANCRRCAFSCDVKHMRQHVGGHLRRGGIISSSDGASGGARASSVVTTAAPEYCGFCCGVITPSGCKTFASNLDKAATSKFSSTCPMFPSEQIRYENARKWSKTSPCTNVPELCEENVCRSSVLWRADVGLQHHRSLRGEPPRLGRHRAHHERNRVALRTARVRRPSQREHHRRQGDHGSSDVRLAPARASDHQSHRGRAL